MKPIRKNFNGIVYYEYKPEGKSYASIIPILMIHGHGGDHRGMEQLGTKMNSHVIIPDLPGFGESDELEAHSIESYVLSLKALMDHLKIKKYNLIGHSLGSGIALALAAHEAKVSKLVLINPVPEFKKFIQYILHSINGVGGKIPQKYSDALVQAKLYNFATFFTHSRQRYDFAHAKQYLATQNSSNYSFKTWSESGEAIYKLNQAELAQKITIPVLLMHGKRDSLTSSATLQTFNTQFTNAQLVEVQKAGHFLPLEQTSDASLIIQTFLRTDHE